jgi:hypothetical protein
MVKVKNNTATEFPQVPLLISKKSRSKNNILVGFDRAQIRFAEQLLDLVCQDREIVKDDDLLGKDENLLLRVTSSNCIDLSPDVKKKTGIWSIQPLESGSAGMNALVRVASEILGEEKPVKEKLEAVSREVCRESEIVDIRGALWEAVWQLTGDVPLKSAPLWPAPWESNHWIPAEVEPSYRLNVLYRDLVGYVFAHENDFPAARKFGISQTRFNRLRQISLDLGRVDQSIRCLSKWRVRKSSAFVCALQISKIWN